MNPSVKDRLGSVVRALQCVVLPALPKEASLAQEQVTLAMGHIGIILAQMDAAPGFLADEATDIERMGADIAKVTAGGGKTMAANSVLVAQLADSKPAASEQRTVAVQNAIDVLLNALAEDGTSAARQAAQAIVLTQGAARAEKDRRWFAAMGFDIDYSEK